MIFILEFEYFCGQSWPILQFGHSLISTEQQSLDSCTKLVKHGVVVNNKTLEFFNVGKSENDTVVCDGKIIQDQIVKFKNIWVDDILLDLTLLSDFIKFEPKYHQGYVDYCNERSIVVADVIKTYEFYFNGAFRLDFECPFWEWYADLRTQKDRCGLLPDQINLYIGESEENQTRLLQKLKELLNSV